MKNDFSYTCERTAIFKTTFNLDNGIGYTILKLFHMLFTNMPKRYKYDDSELEFLLDKIYNKPKFKISVDFVLITDTDPFNSISFTNKYHQDMKPTYMIKFYFKNPIKTGINNNLQDIVFIYGKTDIENFKYFINSTFFKILDNCKRFTDIKKNDHIMWKDLYIRTIRNITYSGDELEIKFDYNFDGNFDSFKTENTNILFCKN